MSHQNLLISLFIILVLIIPIDTILGGDIEYRGEIVEKSFTPESVTSGYGSGITSDGNVGLVNTTSYSSEKFILIIKTIDKNEFKTIEVKPEMYYSVKEGTIVNFSLFQSKYLKIEGNSVNKLVILN